MNANPPGAEARTKSSNVYWFLKYHMNLDVKKGELLLGDDSLDTSHPKYSILWHEYTHYLQNVTTTVGSRIFLNWIAVLVRFSEVVGQSPKLKIPLRFDLSNPFVGFLRDFLDEHNGLIGLSRPLDMKTPSGVKAYVPYIDPTDDSHAYLCLPDSGRNVGIPLYGNIFIEGMPQAVQWLVQTNGKWSDSLLHGKSVTTPQAYYYALFHYFRHHAPDINPCIPVIIVSYAALQTTQPAQFFLHLHKNGMPGWCWSQKWEIIAAQIRDLSAVREGIADSLKLLDEFERDNSDKAGSQFMQMATTVTSIMKTALQDFRTSPKLFQRLINPSPENFVYLTSRFRSPTIYTLDIDYSYAFNEHQELTKFCGLSHALYDLVIGVHDNGLVDECPLLRTRICRQPKDKKTYCHAKRLDFPGETYSTCPMGYAAQLLGLWKKPTQRIA